VLHYVLHQVRAWATTDDLTLTRNQTPTRTHTRARGYDPAPMLTSSLAPSPLACARSCIEFLTRFALTYSALTGDGLCESGRTFLDSCTRHGFLKVVVVDYLASITLNFGALVFGLAVAAITVGMVDQAVLVGPAHNDDRAAVLYTVGGAAWLIATIVLVFIASLLLNIVDASYACVVLDLDNHARVGTFFRPQIAQAVLVKVKPDFVVMQPAGGAAYASSAIPVAQPVAVPVGQPVHHASP